MDQNHLKSVIASGAMVMLLSISAMTKSQEVIDVVSSSASDTTVMVDTASPDALYGGFGYGNNMVYLGSTISQNQPFGYATLVYSPGNEFFISASAFNLSGFTPVLSVYTGALTWSRTFNSWFDLSAGIYGYHVAPQLRDTLFSDFLYTDITAGFDWRILYTKISAGGLLGSQSQAYFQLRNSRYFVTPDIFNGKANVSFDPYFNFIAGTITTATTISGTDTIISAFPPFGGGKNRTQPSTETIYSRSFRIMEVDFGLPVSLNFDIMTIEVEAGYLLPLTDDPAFTSSKGFMLQASLFFRIF
ncbi:MAG: hypothetical protein IH591_00235 [Bacteroidales bacterium]|nr:hypothetical protein [Bacteroidales bacterium]